MLYDTTIPTSKYVIDEKGNKKFTDYENVEVMQNIDKYNQIFFVYK